MTSEKEIKEKKLQLTFSYLSLQTDEIGFVCQGEDDIHTNSIFRNIVAKKERRIK